MQLNSLRAHTDHVMGRDRIEEQWSDLGGKLRRWWRKLKWQDALLPDGDGEYLAGMVSSEDKEGRCAKN